jgi:hemerythrin-like metal-binding protein
LREEVALDSFKWDKNFETGLESIDNQHRSLVDLINRFGDLSSEEGNASTELLQETINQLGTYARFHFKEEEVLMRLVEVDERHFLAQREAPHKDTMWSLPAAASL